MVLKDDRWHRQAKWKNEKRRGKKYEPGGKPQIKREEERLEGKEEDAEEGRAVNEDEEEEEEEEALKEMTHRKYGPRKVQSNGWRFEKLDSASDENPEPELDYAHMHARESNFLLSKHEQLSSDEEDKYVLQRQQRNEFEDLQLRIAKQKQIDSFKQRFGQTSSKVKASKVKAASQTSKPTENLEEFLDDLL